MRVEKRRGLDSPAGLLQGMSRYNATAVDSPEPGVVVMGRQAAVLFWRAQEKGMVGLVAKGRRPGWARVVEMMVRAGDRVRRWPASASAFMLARMPGAAHL